LTLLVGLSAARPVQGTTITKTVSNTHPHPLDRVTYTIRVHATQSGLVTVTDRLPFGVVYAGSLSPYEADYLDGVVTWSGHMANSDIVEIRFDVVVGSWETIGPLPIVNRACAAYDGTQVCSTVAMFLLWRRTHIPVVHRFYETDHLPGLP
jgi:hypothetical protein